MTTVKPQKAADFAAIEALRLVSLDGPYLEGWREQVVHGTKDDRKTANSMKVASSVPGSADNAFVMTVGLFISCVI